MNKANLTPYLVLICFLLLVNNSRAQEPWTNQIDYTEKVAGIAQTVFDNCKNEPIYTGYHEIGSNHYGTLSYYLNFGCFNSFNTLVIKPSSRDFSSYSFYLRGLKRVSKDNYTFTSYSVFSDSSFEKVPGAKNLQPILQEHHKAEKATQKRKAEAGFFEKPVLTEHFYLYLHYYNKIINELNAQIMELQKQRGKKMKIEKTTCAYIEKREDYSKIAIMFLSEEDTKYYGGQCYKISAQP